MLRSIQFFIDPGTRASRVVHELTRAAPELSELAMNDVSLQQLKLSEGLRIPKLRKLTIKAGLMTPSRLRMLLDACPLLEELYDTYHVRSRRNWGVDRRLDGNVELKLLPEYQSE
ncbi:hypothetical protein FRC08_017389 [Ceratobasidium sp. 394]|nr:hypothetical protein FRC08_017389 [Ceratobasidium sp. 394]